VFRPAVVVRLTVLVTAAFALALALPAGAVGGLTPKGCIAETGANVDSCGRHTIGLLDVRTSVVSPDGKNLYTVGGDNEISMFHRGTTTGAVTFLGCIAEEGNDGENCAGTTNGATTAGLSGTDDIALSANGRSVYVVSEGSSAIVRFNRNLTTGLLTPKGCISEPDSVDVCAAQYQPLLGADAVAVSADGKSVYVAATHGIVRFDRDLTTGALTAHGCIEETNDNTVTCGQHMQGVGGAHEILVSPDNKSVYVVSDADNTIDSLKRSRKTGALTPVACLSGNNNNVGCPNTWPRLSIPTRAVLSPDSAWLYVTDNGRILRLSRDPATSALTAAGCVQGTGSTFGCTTVNMMIGSPNELSISSDGRSLYASDVGEYSVERFDRSPTSGALTARNCVMEATSGAGCAQTMKGLNNPTDVDVSPDGTSVYVVGAGSNAVAQLARAG
jgi:6-phosphogluconolactonase (cycloisomerase 2 family)